MLIALAEDQLIDALYAARSRHYVCPACRQPVHLRHGTRVQPHFAHRAKQRCTVVSEGETRQHIQGKRQLSLFFQPWGPVTLERIIPEIAQRADCWIQRPEKAPVAIEFQCSPITTAQVLARTRGYRRQATYPFWILGQRYCQYGVSWSLIERFATRLRGWGLSLLFWDVRRHQLRIDHHICQDALGNYHWRTTWVRRLTQLEAGNQMPLPKVSLDYSRWRSRLARDLRVKNAGVLAVQERLYAAGHHILDVPACLTTKAATLPIFGQGLLLWRALVISQLFAGPVTWISRQMVERAGRQSFETVGGHRHAVWFTGDQAVITAQRELLLELTAQGYLRVVHDGWQIQRRPTWGIIRK
ncbi:competence protein CoiA [Levilactobacillus tujiorum]|uniref:Competence protein n=1 Tax=Levilactobacillus tujiorum TaxID=2912243 RepID=A0ABX1L1K6_9LACO|nr:competence protein CoiA family protein [Levilactobacillus tujiorum]MCH5463917.1 competence protein [Levilactobacillus tujiorum]NLR11577.1 competence protein [Lactobacillus sp. HBUAS51387]NLR28905.1 competence protein [Levilactobacillus tujiorum]